MLSFNRMNENEYMLKHHIYENVDIEAVFFL
jgi:hypothetical protein